MRKILIGGVLVGALSFPAAASAGCWATVTLDPPPPGTGPGEVWRAELTVLQHGANPLPDAGRARPTVTITGADGARRTFTAAPTDPATGRYTARVVFPSAGTWSYAVFDGFTSWDGQPAPCGQTHTFESVAIGGAAGGGAGPDDPASAGGLPAWAMAGGAGAVALAAIALLAIVRRGRSRPAAA